MESFFTDMGEGDRVVAHVGTHSIDLTPEGRPDVVLSLSINDIGYRESADVLEEYILAINCALLLAHYHLRLALVFEADDGKVVFKGDPSFEELREFGERISERGEDFPFRPTKFVFVFERTCRQREFRDPLVF